MKNKLQQLIDESNPKSLGNIVKNHPDVYNWLISQTQNLDPGIGISERIYVVLNQLPSNICDISNKPKRFISSTQGYAFCGRATVCVCAKTSISQKISDKKTILSMEEKSEISKKRAATNLEKYGVSNTGQLVSAKENHKLFYSDNKKVADQVIQQQATMIDRYGVNNPQKDPSIKQRTKNTMRSRYGVDNINQLPERRKRISDQSKVNWAKRRESAYDYNKLNEKFQTTCHVKFITSPTDYNGVLGSRRYEFVCTVCDSQFQTWIDAGHLPVCKICHPTIPLFKSGEENQVVEYLRQLGVTVDQRNRSLINPFELDIVCHDQKIAIEYCGLYWHSESSQHKSSIYHINKMNLCVAKGYRLITIFSDEWNHKKDIVKSKLSSIFGKLQTKIGARKCDIKPVNNLQAKKFYEQNHLQGHVNAKIHLGLWNQDQLVACMSFGHARAFTNNKVKNNEYELLRYASSIVVSGGASRLLHEFEKCYLPTMIFSYADARWSQGNVYHKLGFITKSIPIKAGYWYTRDYSTRVHRFQYTKSKLVKQGHDSNLTEWQIMQTQGWDRIWDCGQYRFEKYY